MVWFSCSFAWIEFCLRGLCGRRFDRLHFELDLDAIADQNAAGLEHLIPPEPEVLPVESGLRDESDSLVAPRIFGSAAVLDIDGHLACHVADGELSDDAIAILLDLLDAIAPEPELGKLLDVEEIR